MARKHDPRPSPPKGSEHFSRAPAERWARHLCDVVWCEVDPADLDTKLQEETGRHGLPVHVERVDSGVAALARSGAIASAHAHAAEIWLMEYNAAQGLRDAPTERVDHDRPDYVAAAAYRAKATARARETAEHLGLHAHVRLLLFVRDGLSIKQCADWLASHGHPRPARTIEAGWSLLIAEDLERLAEYYSKRATAKKKTPPFGRPFKNETFSKPNLRSTPNFPA